MYIYCAYPAKSKSPKYQKQASF